MAFYARRVLQPLALVNERAKAVAKGDLKPRPPVVSNDEFGEFSATFESMVSAIARANEQLLAAERLATIGKMAAHVTHEIRNPLSSMALNVELLEDEIASSAQEARALLRAIRVEVERLTALSEQYLSFGRRQALHLEQENLCEVLSEACDFMRGDLLRRGVTLRLDVPDRELYARVDEAQIKQALYNLVRNAREAMPGGGTIAVTLAAAAEGGADIMVDDQGAGMDEATRSRLFEPFFTTKDHGTGLGLAITRQIVESHAGSISCEPGKNGGTRMLIHLPGAPAADSDSSSQPGQELPSALPH
jgi:signal transduction histidine kinase